MEFKMEGFSGFGEGTSPIKNHEPGKFGNLLGYSRGAHLPKWLRGKPWKIKTHRRKKIGRVVSDEVDKISDKVANVKNRIKVNREIKRRTNNKNENTGSSNSRTLPEIGSTKIPRN